MKHIITYLAKHSAHRVAMMLMLVLGITSSAAASSVLSVSDMVVSAGHEYDLQVNFANDTPVRDLSIDIQLPTGLELVNGAVPVKNSAISQTPAINSLGHGVYRIAFFSFNGKTFAANIGKLFTLKVKATTAIVNGTISLLNPDVTDANNKSIAVTTQAGQVTVKSSFDGTMQFSATKNAISILPGETAQVEVSVENSEALTGMQAVIKLPAGLSIVDDAIVPDPTRAAGAHPAYSAATGIMTLVATSGIKGTTGTLFSFQVKADNTLAASSQISLNDFHFTVGTEYVDYTVSDVVTVSVTNTMADEYAAAVKIVKPLTSTLQDAKNTIATNCKDVAAQFAEQEATLAGQIQNLTTSLETGKADGTLRVAAVQKQADDINAAIVKMIENAKTAQKKFEDDAAAAKKAANDAAYTKLTSQIAAAQTKLNAAKATIATDCKDVASQFDATAATIANKISDLQKDLNAKNAAISLTAESTVNTTDIEAAIAKMVSDAQAAQKKFTEDAAIAAAKKAANDAAYTKLNAQIAATQAQLNAAKATIEKECSDVAPNFKGAIATIAQQISDLQKDLDAKNASISLTAESTVNTTDIEAAIAKLVSDAQAAQKKYEEDMAAEAANEAAYQRLISEVITTQQNLDAATNTINTDYASIASNYTAELAKLQAQVTELKKYVQDTYMASGLTAETQIDTESIDKAIADLLAKAKDAYEDYTGISGVTAEQLVGATYYTLSGNKLNAPMKGQVNLVKFNNGNKIKIFVK